jgi:hypothetical protein
MKNALGYFIGILLLISTSCFAQEVSLPDSIIDKIVVELAEKDHLSFVVDQQAGVLKVYAHSDSLQREEIKSYKIKVVNDELIIADLNTKVKLTEKEVNRLRQELRKEKIRKIISFFEGVATGIVIFIVYSISTHK